MSKGILDPKGINNNPLNDKPYSKKYKDLAKIWSKFPAYKNAKKYIDIIKDYQVILVVSGTGSGKTVLFPKYALHAYDYDGKIAITLPKQIITRSAAEFAADTLDVKVGKYVGYKYRGSPQDSKSVETKLLYATDGTIVAKLLFNPKLEEFDTVIVDEAHERKVQIDFLLYLLKETLKVRKDFKVIIMSATINSEIFKNYFKEFKFYDLNVGGKTNYPIKSVFLKKAINVNNFVKEGVEIILKILKEDNLKKKGDHDIMFFVTSANEAYEACKLLNFKLERTNISVDEGIFCVEVFAGMDKELQELAQNKDLYKKNKKYKRKIVITTNVAESSLTIEGVKYVIESGYELLGTYDAKLRGRKLDKSFISHAQAKQRMGRAGRTGPGVCYHLYTKDFFEKNMKRFPEPDIRKQDITMECLRLLNTDNVKDTKQLRKMLNNFIEPPDEVYFELAMSNLNMVGALKIDTLTKLGKLMGNLGMEPLFALPLITSKLYNCTNEVINIISIISAARNNLGAVFKSAQFLLKNNAELKEDLKKYNEEVKKMTKIINDKRKLFHHEYGDHMSLLNVFNDFKKLQDNDISEEEIENWCGDNYLNYKTLVKARKNARRNKRLVNQKLKTEKVNEVKEFLINKDDINLLKLDDRIMVCLLSGYKIQVANQSSKNNEYVMDHDKKKKISIDSNSFLLMEKNLPKSIFYHELFMMMGNSSFNIVSKINQDIKDLFKK